MLRGLTEDWCRLAPGVYLAGPTGVAAPFLARVWAGVLLGGDGARAWSMTAALLDGLADPGVEGSERVDAGAAEVVHVIVPGRDVGPHPGFAFARERPGVRLPSRSIDPARTRIEDTTLDLCAAADTDQDVITWITRACQRRLTTPERLARRLEERTRVRRRRLIRTVLVDASQGVTSHLELRALRTVFRPHGLPFQLQARLGARIADAMCREFAVIVELDGRVGHTEEGAFRDRHRDNLHAAAGLVTLRFGWWDLVNDPCGVAQEIRAVLVARGWSAPPPPCSRCRRRLAS